MNVIRYLQEVREEMYKITWPSRHEVIYLSEIVIGTSIAVALYVGGLDYAFTSLLGSFLK